MINFCSTSWNIIHLPLQVKIWEEQAHPLLRFRKYLTAKGLWSDEKETEFRESIKKEASG